MDDTSKIWLNRIGFVITFFFFYYFFKITYWIISVTLGTQWAMPLILGFLFAVGMIINDYAQDDELIKTKEIIVEKNVLLTPYNYIAFDLIDRKNGLHITSLVESDTVIDKKIIKETEKDYIIDNIYPTYILDADEKDKKINKIKGMVEK